MRVVFKTGFTVCVQHYVNTYSRGGRHTYGHKHIPYIHQSRDSGCEFSAMGNVCMCTH